MLTVMLNKQDLILLVKSIQPLNDMGVKLEHLLVGHMCRGNYKDWWEWNDKRLESMEEEELWQLYKFMRGSENI